MTLSSTISKQSYDGDGATTSFPIPFLFLDNAHIEAVLRDAAGNEAVWTENTEYTLVGAGDQDGGTLTVATALVDYTPQADETLVIRRVVPTTQETAYPEGGAFPAMAHEAALDKLTMLAQQNDEQLGRALRFRVSDPPSLSGEIPGAAARASRFLAFDADGAPIAAAGQVGGVPVSSFMATLLDDVTAAVARGTLGISLTGVDLYVRDFGAVGDGSTDDTAAFTAAIAALDAGQRLRVGIGTFVVGGIVFDKPGILQLERGATLKLKAGQPLDTRLLTVAADDVLVIGGIWDGNRAGQGAATGQDCIYHAGRSNVHVDVDHITGAVGFGFHAVDATDCSVRVPGGVTLTGNVGIQWEYAAGDLTRCVTRDTLVDRSDDAANANPCVNYTKTGTAAGMIVGCKVVNCDTRLHTAPTGANAVGIQMWGAGHGNQVIGGEIEGGTTGISIANGMSETKVVGTHSYNFAYAGIELADCKNCAANGNTVDGNGVASTRGIVVDGTNVAATGNAVCANTIKNVTDTGIYFLKGNYGCTGSSAVANTIDISGASAYGIYSNAASDLVISGNTIEGNNVGLAGIALVQCSYIALVGNIIRNLTTQAILATQNVAGTMDYITVVGTHQENTIGISFQTSGGGTLGDHNRITAVPGIVGDADGADFLDVANGLRTSWSSGTPEGVVTASPGSLHIVRGGTAGYQLWQKASGTGNTGWVKVDVPLTGSKTWDPPSIANGTSATTTVTVPGAALGDFAACSFDESLQGLFFWAYVSAADTVTVLLYNATGAAVDLASTTLRARVLKQ